MFTKLQTVRIAVLFIFVFCSVPKAYSQAAEAALAAAITANTVAISDQMAETKQLQMQIVGENAVISGLLEGIYDYEKLMYDYMSKAQDVVTSAYTIGKCFQMGSDIISELEGCCEEAKKNPQGAILTLVTDQYTEVLAESAALTAYLVPIVQGNGKQNLLNSAERINILNTVSNRLYMILESVRSLRYGIRRMNLATLVLDLSPEAYYTFFNKNTAYDVALDVLKEAEAQQ